MALGHVGVTQAVESPTEQTVPAQECAKFWPAVLDAALADRWWPFATRIVDLALISDDYSDSWQYSYRFPTEAVTFRRIEGDDGWPPGVRIPFRMESDDDGRLVVTDEADARGEVTWRITQAERLPEDFALAASFLLGHYLATPLARERPQLRAMLLEQWKYARNTAWANHSNQQQAAAPRDADWITARDA